MADPKKISQFDVAQTFSEGDFLSGIQQVAPSEYKNVKIPHSAMLGISSEMFELVDNDGNPYIKAKLDLLGEKAITAYATGTLGNDVWKDMPIATTDSLGGIMLGDHLTITPEGKLSVVAENLGLNESAIVNLVNSSTEINVYDSKRLGGKLPTDYSLATHTHFNHTAGAGLTGNAYNGGAAVEWGVSPTIITQLNQLSTMFELVPNSGNPYIKAKLDLLGQKGITAYATGTLGNDIWADLPVATDVTLGGVKVSPGSGLVMNGEQLEIDGDSFNLNNYYTKTNIDDFFAGTTAKTGYNKSNWDSAYADRLKWNGGNTGLDAATGRASLGLTGTVTTHTHTDVPNLTYYSGYDANELITGRLSNYGSATYWENAPSNMLYGGIIAFGGASVPASKSLGLQIAYDINHNTTGLTKNIWFRSGGSTPNGVEWGTDWFKLYHTGNLVNPIKGTGSAGKVAWWKSATELDYTKKLTYDFTNSLLEHQGHTTLKGSYSLPVTGGTDINGSLRIGSSGTGVAMDIGVSSTTGAWGAWLQGRNAGDQSYYYSIYLNPNGGGVAVGKMAVTSGYKLDVNGNTRVGGNILATGEVTAYTASDKRLKTNINKFGNALSIIDKLTPVTYNWNAKAVELNGNKDMTGVNYGLIAQEVEKIAPDLIRKVYGDYKTYDDRGLMTIMLQAIKELKAEVDLLKNKN